MGTRAGLAERVLARNGERARGQVFSVAPVALTRGLHDDDVALGARRYEGARGLLARHAWQRKSGGLWTGRRPGWRLGRGRIARGQRRGIEGAERRRPRD